MRWYEKQKELYLNKEQNNEKENSEADNINAYEDALLNEELLSMIEEPDKTIEKEPTSAFSFSQPIISRPATCIGSGTSLHGNITTEDDLIIHGIIEGDIVCKSVLTITGRVKGSIQCDTCKMEEADVIGDIYCQGNLEISVGTILEGNIQTHDMLCGGRIKGNIEAEGSVTLTAQSGIIGDIRTLDMEIHRGAIMKGNMQINQEISFDPIT